MNTMMRAAAALAVAAGVSTACAGAASATSQPTVPPRPDTSKIEATRGGDLTLVDANRRGVVLENGGSATEFSFDLPKGSVCPGDSMNDSWRVQTFIIPKADEPSSIEYSANGPTGKGQYAAYDAFTQSVVDLLTVPNDTAGLPGRIEMFPPLSFKVFPKGELADGDYRIGTACTWFGATGPYWDTVITIKSNEKDEPAGFTWRLPDAPEATLSGTSSPTKFPITAVFIAVAAVALLFVVVLNRRERTKSPVG
ncbi:MAG: hypothetical protein ACOYMR_07630 [Ilumatobacteraceae bacterium]